MKGRIMQTEIFNPLENAFKGVQAMFLILAACLLMFFFFTCLRALYAF